MKVHVTVPATTANLGPGFDALGLALNLWNEADFVCSDDSNIVVTIEGEGKEKLKAINSRLAELSQIFGDNLLNETNSFELHLENDVDVAQDIGKHLFGGAEKDKQGPGQKGTDDGKEEGEPQNDQGPRR